jgi:hypothetical protein
MLVFMCLPLGSSSMCKCILDPLRSDPSACSAHMHACGIWYHANGMLRVEHSDQRASEESPRLHICNVVCSSSFAHACVHCLCYFEFMHATCTFLNKKVRSLIDDWTPSQPSPFALTFHIESIAALALPKT